MDVFEQAMAFALKAHDGQTRKRDNTPYILHPCEAATIASILTDDREILAAVVLHDTVEDTDATLDDIREQFGNRVAMLVEGETETAYDDRPRSESWQQRKEESLEHLKNAEDVGVKIMWLSDKLSNMRSFHRQYLIQGDAMWENYHQKDKAKQEWYYRTIADLLKEFDDSPVYQEYLRLTDVIFGGNK